MLWGQLKLLRNEHDSKLDWYSETMKRLKISKEEKKKLSKEQRRVKKQDKMRARVEYFTTSYGNEFSAAIFNLEQSLKDILFLPIVLILFATVLHAPLAVKLLFLRFNNNLDQTKYEMVEMTFFIG